MNLQVGASLAGMTDAEVLELFNEMLEAQAEIAAGVDPTLTEIPPGLPQIEYNERSDQWVPRGQVLRCHIEDDAEEGTIMQIDDLALGESLPMIEKLLGHTQVQTTARYALLANESVKASGSRVGDSIGMHIRSTPGSGALA